MGSSWPSDPVRSLRADLEAMREELRRLRDQGPASAQRERELIMPPQAYAQLQAWLAEQDAAAERESQARWSTPRNRHERRAQAARARRV